MQSTYKNLLAARTLPAGEGAWVGVAPAGGYYKILKTKYQPKK